MATAGLSFANPFLNKVGVGEAPNPYVPYSPTSSIGMGGLAPSAADMAVLGESLVEESRFTMPEMRKPTSIAYNRATNELFVQGVTFAADDAASALEAESLLGSPGVGLPTEGGWQPLDESSYRQYVESIRNPSLGRLASKNFGRGIDIMQLLGGRALQLAGAEDLGGRVVAQQEEDLAKTAPFDRRFTDIDSGSEAVDWFVANFAQQGPNLIESVAAGVLGFLGGTAAGGPAAGLGGALAGLVGKSAFKKSVIEAATRRAAVSSETWKTALNAAKQKAAARQTLSVAEKEILKDNKLLREAAGLAGATVATLGSSYGMGAADIYGELREQGADADDVMARLTALSGGVPYAAMESLSEFLVAGRVLGGIGAPKPMRGMSAPRRGLELLRRGTVGAGVGGLAEGLTEAGQESLLLGLSGQDFSSPENVKRLIDSFAAGFAVGGPIGGIANLRGKESANLLNPSDTQGGTLPTPGTPTQPGTQGVLNLFDDITDEELAARMRPPVIEAPAPVETPASPDPRQGQLALGRPVPPMRPPVQGELDLRPVVPPGGQGVLDLFGGDISRAELDARMQPPVAEQPVSAAARPNLIPITYESFEQNADGSYNGNRTITGSAPIIDFQGRKIVLVDVNGVQVPFYLSSGAGGKKNVAAGKWYPFFGIGADAWINKGTQAEINNYYGSPELKAVAENLDATIGDIRSDNTIPRVKATGAHIAAINQGLNPTENSLSTTRDALNASVQSILDRIGRGQIAPPVAPVSDPRQGALQFSTPLPGEDVVLSNPQMAQQLAEIRAQQERQRAFELAEAEQAARREEELRALERDSRNEQDLTTAEIAQLLSLAADRVEREPRRIGPTEPMQLPLFGRREAPTPSRGETLRRGARAAESIPEIQAVRELPPEQLSLFPEEEVAETLKARPRKKTRVARPRKKTTETTPDAVQEQGAAEVSAREQTGTGEAVGRPVPRKRAAPRKSEALKKGKAQTQKQPVQDVTPVTPEYIADVRKAYNALNLGQRTAVLEELGITRDQLADAITNRTEDVDAAVARARRSSAAPQQSTRKPNFETNAGQLAAAIEDAKSATDLLAFRGAMVTIFEFAFFSGESTSDIKVVNQARAFLATAPFSDAQIAEMDAAFLASARYVESAEAIYSRGRNKGKPRPWYTYAKSRSLLNKLSFPVTNQPKEDIKDPITNASPPGPNSSPSVERVAKTPEARLADFIDYIRKVARYEKIDQIVEYGQKKYKSLEEAFSKLYAAVSEQGRDYLYNGNKLRDYFNADGTPKLLKSDDRITIITQEVTAELQAETDRTQREARRSAAADRAQQAAEADQTARDEKRRNPDSNTTTDAFDQSSTEDDAAFYRANGTAISGSIPIGRVRLLVKGFLNKLRMKPRVHIYASVADLKRRNPTLYRRAAAARAQKDFDTTPAMGYSFGADVILFTDFIRTEQQLRFVLAHETLGHFGFKGIMPKAELDKILNRIYDVDPSVQAAVDAMVANQGMTKLEAIEEFLADNAAELDSSIILRIWNGLKNFLNKLGFEFQDDDARYLVGMARKYVRRGDTGNFLSARSIVENFDAMEQANEDGRYARVYAGNMGSTLFSIGALNRNYGNTGGLLGAMYAFTKKVFGARANVPGNVSRLLELLQTLDNKARRSYGLSQIYRLLERQQQYVRVLMTKYHAMTQFTNSPTIFGFGNGVTEAQKETAGELLARAALLRSKGADELIESFDALVSIDDMGNITINEDVRKAIIEAGYVTAEEFRKGFDITYSDGSTVRFQFDVDDSFTTDPTTGEKIFTDPVWRVYNEIRTTINESAIDLMLANFEAAQSENRRIISDLNRSRRGDNVFTEDDLAIIKRVAEIYKTKFFAGSEMENAALNLSDAAREDADAFLIAFGRALFNDDVYAVWMKDPNAKPEIVKDLKEVQNAEYDDIRVALADLRSRLSEKDKKAGVKGTSGIVQKAVRDIAMFDLMSRNADYRAKRTILGSYVPFSRRGTEEVRLVAVDSAGRPVELDESIKSTLPYFQFETRAEALEAANELNKVFGENNEFILRDEAGNETTLNLRVEVARVQQGSNLADSVNINQFVYVMNRFDITLTPRERERVITSLTKQDEASRKSLQRSGNEGWDKDVVRSAAEHLETSAHRAGKTLFHNRLDDVLLNPANWRGDPERLAALKAAVDNAKTDGERARAERAYNEYAYMYRYMAATGENKTVTINGKEMPTLGRGADYLKDAQELLAWYSSSGNISDSTEDALSGETGSRLKLITVLMQLGGSVATSVVNLVSLPTHSWTYLSYYNPERHYGGGYGPSKAGAALHRAVADLKNPKLADATFLEQILKNNTYAQYGLTKDEAEFLARQTAEGTLQAAQFNALAGTSRGKVFSNKAQAGVRLWMSMFSYTEQLNRRATALATYRLERARLQAWGVTDPNELRRDASEAARAAVTYSQGEYAMFVRPAMARGNIFQYVFMYKQFTIITVQLLRSMPRAGQLHMLGLLLLASGLKGLPFAEDLFDLVDTLAQALGFKMASVEKALAEWIDDIAPGMTPYAMRGIMDQWTGATVSTRLGMGNLLPLTGLGKAGADPMREVSDFFGPAFSGLTGLAATAGSVAKYGAEAIGLRDDTTTISGILRNSPIAAGRALADGFNYLSTGTITNNRGQVVSQEAPYHVVLARWLGFYPAIATQQNDIVRLSKSTADYAKAIKADYVSAYRNAVISKDRAAASQVLKNVREWNADARGTGLEVRNFLASANRAVREAQRPTAARYLKSAPAQMRPETIELLRINGLEDEIR